MKNATRGWATSTRFYLGSRSLEWPVRVYVYMHVVSSVSNWVNNAKVFLSTYILLCYCWRPSTRQFLWTILSYILVDWWPQIFAKCSVCRGEELNWPMSCATIETASSTPLHGLLVLIWPNSGLGITYLHSHSSLRAWALVVNFKLHNDVQEVLHCSWFSGCAWWDYAWFWLSLSIAQTETAPSCRDHPSHLLYKCMLRYPYQ